MTHTFTPSRPGGTVCVLAWTGETLDPDTEQEVCGYPAGHPIHATAPAPTLAEPFEETLARAGERDDARQALATLRETLHTCHGGECLALLDRIERAL